LGWPRGGFDVDGDRATDLIVTSGKRSLLFRGSDTGPERLPSWEWTTVSGRFSFIFARDFDRDGHADIVAIEYADTGARIAAYPGGLVTGARPEYPDGFSCQAHAGDLPDLGVDADALRRSVAIRREVFDADSCELAEQCIGAPGERRLLEFTASIQNFGGAPAELPGPSIAPDLYEFDACHDHHHLVGFASYELVDRDGLVVVAGHKQGYYLVDSVAYCDTAPREPPDSDVLWISPGWSDVYPAGLACQWIDITGVPDGDYQLRVRVNTDGTFEEDDQISNEGLVSVRIRGDEVVAGE
jgi:hypothetical protein